MHTVGTLRKSFRTALRQASRHNPVGVAGYGTGAALTGMETRVGRQGLTPIPRPPRRKTVTAKIPIRLHVRLADRSAPPSNLAVLERSRAAIHVASRPRAPISPRSPVTSAAACTPATLPWPAAAPEPMAGTVGAHRADCQLTDQAAKIHAAAWHDHARGYSGKVASNNRQPFSRERDAFLGRHTQTDGVHHLISFIWRFAGDR